MTAPGLFVTATDTGVGKTIVAAALVAVLRDRGQRVAAVKPVLTGTDEAGGEPRDDELLARCAGLDPAAVTTVRYGPAVSPHLAAELAGRPLDVPALLTHARAARTEADAMIVEGIGGLLVPLAPGHDVRSFAVALGLPVVIAARPGLGTINHTLLTLEAARSTGLDVRAVVITPWPEPDDRLTRSNRETIAKLGRVEVAGLPVLARLEPATLAAAGASLPVERWLGSDRGPG